MADSEANHAVSDVGRDENDGKCEGKAAASVSESGGSCGVEETSPDSLKNTPANIAKLEDAIEQCEGRQKYLAQTRSPSDGSDVRWYFCKVPLAENELAASVPRMEIVGKGDYFRFGMRDSLAIEASFLQREEELLSSWWKEYAECSEGPRGRPSTSNKLDPPVNAFSSDNTQSAFSAVEEERVGVPVKGGLYEVDLVRRHCFPVYWSGENRRVLRGHWFARKGGLDWLPLREDVSEQLEFAYRSQVWHRRTFQPSGLFAARVDMQGFTVGLHALFTGEDDTWEAWLYVDASGISSVISLSGKGMKLRRGYSPSQSVKPTQDELRQQKEEEMDDYCSQVPVRHLVFMVHGIGQRLEKSNLVDDVGNFRHITSSLAERHLTQFQLGTQRVLFIPCQWRKGLKLSGEAAVEKITLDGVRGLRVTLSATVHDVLYYMSPIYCQDIINSVSNQLNWLYLKFLKRNPGYDGKVSIYGHSLGSVLSYDILCHQEKLSSPFPMDWMYKERARKEESSPNTSNHSSESTSLTSLEDKNFIMVNETQGTVNESTSLISLEDKNFIMVNETQGTVNSLDEDNTSAQTTLLVNEEEHADDSSVIVDPLTFNSNEHPVEASDSNEINSNTCIHESGSDCSHVLSGKDDLDEATSIDSGVSVSASSKMTVEVPIDTSDKDTVVKMLGKEIDFLKERIAELELMSRGKDSIEGLHEGNEVGMTLPKNPVSDKLPPGQDTATKSYTPHIKYTKLEFKVDTFFAVGSPLGVFLALRNIRIGIDKGRDYWGEENISEEMPACRRMFNIFHPFDPVAYRIEPLICKEYITKRPVIIPYHKGGKRLHIGFHEFTEDLAARSQAIMDRLSSVRVKVLTVCQSRNRESLEEATENSDDKEERSYGSLMMERLTGSEEGRVDHMLQDKTFEHPYISAIGSHTNYWRDNDTALFILKYLFQDIPEDPKSSGESDRGISKNERGSTGWSNPREAADEELPLTFSDAVLVRDFSRKAKKILKK